MTLERGWPLLLEELSRFFIKYGIRTFGELLRNLVDIGIVAYILYKIFSLIRGTRAVTLVNGIFVLGIAYLVARILELYTIQFILEKGFLAASVALPIIFQPELRRALEHLGRGRLLPTKGKRDELKEDEVSLLVDQIVRAAEILGRNKTGALIVLERETGLGEFIDSGIRVDGKVSWELLTNIFIPNTPLHDGAVIIAGNQVAAAACWLPLAEASVLAHELGTRHRAGVGITEQSDAITIIISEETGTISVAQSGKLTRHLDEKTLREMLIHRLEVKKTGLTRSFWHWGNQS